MTTFIFLARDVSRDFIQCESVWNVPVVVPVGEWTRNAAFWCFLFPVLCRRTSFPEIETDDIIGVAFVAE